ncbi:Retrovirus-related Pol polyprotein from transposon TNT 1-94 [Vitis vinifera]|uniref:Retrovirus-related Pol polyprotein from transposon TNT 1-94 n=1 Tax=Vitis vinifera TaxID=29760 RepID=A0A438ISQ1_VITVI|nr:Retrovirus-related Pol polyprotein from transposon TNT 1-94 [Vitis vinifera]
MGQGYEDHLVTQEADILEVDKVQWRKIDAQLCSVLWQSVDPKILHHLRAYKTCFKFWNQAKGLYTNDIQRLYKVASSIVNVRQQDMDLSTYIGQIASLKEEFLTMMPLTTNVGDQRIQIDKFFMVLTLIGLRPDLETVRDQIFSSSSVPSLDDVFARLLRISSTQTLPSDNTSNSSVLVSQTNSQGGCSGNRGRGQRPHCTYCNKLGHTRDRCYQLHGRPPRTAHVAQSSDPQSPQPPSSSTSQGIFLTDSESDSSDHISGNKDLFSSITTTSALPTVTLANGSQTMAKGFGFAHPLLSLPLHSVLYAPECPFNLIFISKITRTLNCSITFSDKFATLQDRSTGKTIGIGRESQGLYHLTSPSPAVCISTDAPLLIHNRLGHPSLSKFQKMVPSFSSLSSLACESCQLGKHTRVSFPKRLNNQAKSPFELVHRLHTDVTGVYFRFQTNFLPEATKCIFLGYSRLQKGYRCYFSETHRYFLSADVTFFEDSPVYHRRHRVIGPPSLAAVPADSPPIPSASPVPLCLLLLTYPLLFGKSTPEALSHPGWRQAMVDEMAALHSNDTWDLVVLPSGKSIVGCRWVYTGKVGPDGQIDCLKACLVAKAILSGAKPRSEAVSLSSGATPRFAAVLGLSSIQIYFILLIRYEDHLITQKADIPEVDRVQWRKIDAQPKDYTRMISSVFIRWLLLLFISANRDLDLSTYIGQIASLKEEFLTVMPLTLDVGAQQTQLDKFFMVLTLIGLCPDLEPFLTLPLEEDAVVTEVRPTSSLHYCNKLGHTRDRCYQLHGRPPRTAHVAQSSDSQLPQPPNSSASQASQASVASVVQPGNASACLTHTSSLEPWILDSGASNHLSGNKDLFSSITTTSALPNVTLANGSQTVAKGPEYGEDDCIGRESQGLYHLTSDSSPAVCISTDAPLLIHNRLGHPSLSKLQKLPCFSTLSSLPCESCQLGKHTRVSFPKRLSNWAKSPFELVHTDILGDNAREFFSPFTSFMSHHGILHQSSCAHTPQQNGIVERKNRHLVETARTILLHSNVPFRFWEDVVLIACYLINRMPSSVLHDQIPHSLLFPNQPLYFLPPRVFGCTCFVHILTPGQDKLSAKAMKCLFLGYSRLLKGYRCYSLETHRYFIFADVTFFEDSPFFSTTSESLPVSEVLPIPIVSPPDAMPPRPLQVYHRRLRVVAPLPFAEAPADSLPIPSTSLPRLCLLLMTYLLLFGKSTHEAFSHPGWRQAMVDEMAALHSNGTWDLVVYPLVDRLKAHLVAKGYTQVYGSDYGDTFSPVAKIASGESGLVCRLRRSLYGLKQSPRAWFGRFSSVVQEFGMLHSTADHSVFYHHNSLGQCIYLVVYVDDIVITGNDQDGIQKLKQHLFTHFQTKDLGKLKYFLGIEIAQSSSGVVLSQRKYALDILEETGSLDCKLVDTPMDPNVKLVPGQGEPLGDPGRYRRLVGKLNYLTITRPDISFLENRGHTQVVGYTDADWAGSPIDRRSTSAYCVFIGGNLISWKSKKQDVVARSSAETEYRAMDLATCELIWLRHLLRELRFGKDEQMKLVCDNQAALHIASNPVFHERTKHIEVDCHFIKEKITSGCVATSFVNSNDQLANIFTKSLRGPRIKYICNKLGAYDGESDLVCRLRRSLYGLKQSPRAWFSRFSSVVQEFGMFRSTADHSVFYHHNSSGQCIYLHTRPSVLYENRDHTQVVGYTDADWAGSPTDRRSTSGYCVFIGGNLISWKSKKQDVVARSSAEAEYRAMALATCELIWLKHLLRELRFGKDEQMKLICDNQAALHIASNLVFHERTKHIEVDCHFIREKIASGWDAEVALLEEPLFEVEVFNALLDLGGDKALGLDANEVIDSLLKRNACGVICLPLGAPFKFVSVWDGVEERLRKRLTLWKRIVKIRLEQIQKDFLWAERVLERKPHLVQGAIISSDKSKDGWG